MGATKLRLGTIALNQKEHFEVGSLGRNLQHMNLVCQLVVLVSLNIYNSNLGKN